MLAESTKHWLLDSDPAIRCHVMRDFGLESPETVRRERARIESEGWGALLLDRQRPDGLWGDDIHAPLWQTTLGSLVMLKDLGLDPTCARARSAVERVHEQVTWGPEFNDSPFFDGEVEPCINGRALGIGAYFGRPSATPCAHRSTRLSACSKVYWISKRLAVLRRRLPRREGAEKNTSSHAACCAG